MNAKHTPTPFAIDALAFAQESLECGAMVSAMEKIDGALRAGMPGSLGNMACNDLQSAYATVAREASRAALVKAGAA